MNEGQLELIDIINSVETTIDYIKKNLNGNQEVKEKAEEIKELANEIVDLSKNKDWHYNKHIKLLKQYESKIKELKFKEFGKNSRDIAKLIANNLPDYLKSVIIDNQENDEEDIEFSLELIDYNKKLIKDGHLGIVKVGSEVVDKDNGQRKFSVTVELVKTYRSDYSIKSFELQSPLKVYPLLQHIHMCTSYTE